MHKWFVAVIMVCAVSAAVAQDLEDNQSCLDCHGEADLTGEIGGQEVSMFVDPERYENSVHGYVLCIDCHSDISELPHDLELEKADCSMCHEDPVVELEASVHGGEAGPDCASCHGSAHAILPSSDGNSLANHQNIIRQCSTCHGSEDNPAESRGGEGQTHAASFMESVHGEAWLSGNADAANCVDCHGYHQILPAANPDSLVNKFNVAQTCSDCHAEITETFVNSIHGRSVANGSEDAATCTDCHGEHEILHVDDERSMLTHTHIYDMCGQCHFDVTLMDQYGLATAEQETLVKGSVHAEQVRLGNPDAPTCVNCHGFHDTLPLRDPDSPSNFMNVANTCGQCHGTERDQFLESVHGESMRRGHKDAPVCTDCHGEHAILRAEDERSPVSLFNLSENTCARCHASIVINDKYGIEVGRVETFMDSYHGLALQHGSKRVANCGSCHGNHLILASDNPKSTVSPERLVETCGKCHPGIGDNVLAAPIHTDITIRSEAIQAWVPRIYLFLIVAVIGGMLVHNGFILWVLLKEKFRKEKGSRRYQRFTPFEIVMHILLTVSFITLVITGFALVSPNSWWVVLLSYMQMDETVRSTLHRIAGVILIGISAVYGVYMLGTRRGRSEFWAFMPRLSDIAHVRDQIQYLRGKRQAPPKFDRYDYTEKMEFWALVWGVIIMAVTGLILWFPILSFQYLPKWAIDMAELIHYYEAVLATLAIAIWHFFFVIFHPEEYPMSTSWLTGEMTEDHLKHRHPGEYERIKDSEPFIEPEK